MGSKEEGAKKNRRGNEKIWKLDRILKEACLLLRLEHGGNESHNQSFSCLYINELTGLNIFNSSNIPLLCKNRNFNDAKKY